MTEPIDVEYLRGWIGRELVAEDLVTRDLAAKFHATFDRPGDPPGPGYPVPLLLHFCLAQPLARTGGLDDDGHQQRGGFLPPVPLPRRMWAGGEVVAHDVLCVDDRVRRVSRVRDVALKQGRSGALCFVTIDHELDVDGRAVLTERQDVVYREAEAWGASAVVSPSPAPTGAFTRRIDVAAPFLFRYSALTFNSHRIHYDRGYAVNVENYSGLVVHGPLQATLLAELATEIGGKPPVRFSFRSQSSLSDDAPFLIDARRSDSKLELWTTRNGGSVAMMAEANW